MVVNLKIKKMISNTIEATPYRIDVFVFRLFIIKGRTNKNSIILKSNLVYSYIRLADNIPIINKRTIGNMCFPLIICLNTN